MFKHDPYNKFKSDKYRLVALAIRSLCHAAVLIIAAVYGGPDITQWLAHWR